MSDRPSAHFAWAEMACKDGTPYPEEWRDTRGVELAFDLERIRLEIGPFVPTSVYRTWAHHASIYAHMRPPQKPPAKSQHLEGRAGDVPCPPDMKWADFVAAIRRAVTRPESHVRYVKFYRAQRFAHIDTRPGVVLKIEGA